MQTLILTLGVFIAFHLIPAAPPIRRGLISVIGKAPYIVGYSLMSLGLLGWVGIAYGEADYIEVWAFASWMRWVPLVSMVPACVLLVGSLTHANPLSVALRGDGFDPERPGIVSVTRHPLMWALVLWSGSHMVPNGDVASLIMFGLFTVLGLAGPKILDAKARRQLGAERWAALAGPTSNVPFYAAIAGHARIDWKAIAWVPGLGGLALYAVLLGGHLSIIGVSPLP